MKNRMLGLFLAGLVAAPLAANAGTIWGVNGHEYEVVTAEGIKWTDATTAAQASGWYLATVSDSAENDFIKTLLNSGLAERSHFWLGATDSATEGTFVWVDGTPWSFTNWWGGEPNNSGNEDYLAMDLRGGSWGWNDAPDNLGDIYKYARGYIMERVPGSSVPEPGSLALLGLGIVGVALTRRRK